jgi:hypothetical protein
MKFIYFIILQLICFSGYSQINVKADLLKDCGVVYANADIIPKYNGGLEKLESILNEKLDFNKSLSYKTFINFTVDCEGNIGKFTCQGNGNAKYNMMLIDALLEVSDWQAGENRGKKISCLRTIGFTIKNGKIKLEIFQIK